MFEGRFVPEKAARIPALFLLQKSGELGRRILKKAFWNWRNRRFLVKVGICEPELPQYHWITADVRGGCLNG